MQNKQIKDYKFTYPLGKNNLSTCYRVVSQKTKDIFLAKAFSKQQFPQKTEILKKLFQEIKFLLSKNPNEFIVKCIDKAETPNNYYIFIENCDNWMLSSYLRQQYILKEYEATHYLRQIFIGYDCLQKGGLNYRDFTTHNILMHGHHVKIDDLGFSKFINYSVLKINDRIYRLSEAPEAYLGNYLQQKSDVWSLGIIYYAMLFGELPWKGSSHQQLLQNVYNTKLIFPKNINDLSQDCKDLLKQMLRVKPQERIAWNDILHHPIFAKLELERLRMTNRKVSESQQWKIKFEIQFSTPFFVEEQLQSLEDREQKSALLKQLYQEEIKKFREKKMQDRKNVSKSQILQQNQSIITVASEQLDDSQLKGSFLFNGESSQTRMNYNDIQQNQNYQKQQKKKRRKEALMHEQMQQQKQLESQLDNIVNNNKQQKKQQEDKFFQIQIPNSYYRIYHQQKYVQENITTVQTISDQNQNKQELSKQMIQQIDPCNQYIQIQQNTNCDKLNNKQEEQINQNQINMIPQQQQLQQQNINNYNSVTQQQQIIQSKQEVRNETHQEIQNAKQQNIISQNQPDKQNSQQNQFQQNIQQQNPSQQLLQKQQIKDVQNEQQVFLDNNSLIQFDNDQNYSNISNNQIQNNQQELDLPQFTINEQTVIVNKQDQQDQVTLVPKQHQQINLQLQQQPQCVQKIDNQQINQKSEPEQLDFSLNQEQQQQNKTLSKQDLLLLEKQTSQLKHDSITNSTQSNIIHDDIEGLNQILNSSNHSSADTPKFKSQSRDKIKMPKQESPQCTNNAHPDIPIPLKKDQSKLQDNNEKQPLKFQYLDSQQIINNQQQQQKINQQQNNVPQTKNVLNSLELNDDDIEEIYLDKKEQPPLKQNQIITVQKEETKIQEQEKKQENQQLQNSKGKDILGNQDPVQKTESARKSGGQEEIKDQENELNYSDSDNSDLGGELSSSEASQSIQQNIVKEALDSEENKEIQQQKNFQDILDIIQNHLQKYEIYGNAVVQAEQVLNAFSNKFIISCFLLHKKMFLIRHQVEQIFQEADNIYQYQNWEQFLDSQQFDDFFKELQAQNDEIFINTKNLLRLTEQKVTQLPSNEKLLIKEHLCIDISEGFEETYLHYICKHYKEVGASLARQKQMQESDQLNFLKHQAQILDCVIIGEIGILQDCPEQFDLKEYKEIQLCGNRKLIEVYLDKKVVIVNQYLKKHSLNKI